MVDGTAAQPLATRIAILNSLTLAEPGGGWQSRARRGAHREPLSRWQFSAARHTVRAGRISVPGGRAPCTQSAALAPAPLVSTAARALPWQCPGSKILLATPGFEGFQPPRKPLWDTVGAQSLTAARNVWRTYTHYMYCIIYAFRARVTALYVVVMHGWWYTVQRKCMPFPARRTTFD